MTLIQRAMQHNCSAFLVELHTAAAVRRMHGDRHGEQQINQSIIALEAGDPIENEWTLLIAKRLIHGIS